MSTKQRLMGLLQLLEQNSTMCDARLKAALRHGISEAFASCPDDWSQDIHDFHFAMQAVTNPYPTRICYTDPELLKMRKRIMNEEYLEEFLPALDKGDLVAVADGGIDSIVTIIGTLWASGIDPRPHWAAVQRTNMAKRDPETGMVRRRADGKILKPEGWEPPDLAAIIEEQMK